MINSWLAAKRWLLRRFSLCVDLSLHFWPRQVPRRLAFFGCALFMMLVYVLLQWPSNVRRPGVEHCVADYLIRKGISHPLVRGGEGESVQWRENRVSFIGNGFLGMDIALDRHLVKLSNESVRAHLHTGFNPLVDVQMPLASQQDSLVFTDPDDGVARSLHCSSVSGKCVCISQTVYLHRTRADLLVQDIHVINPSASSFSISFARHISGDWEQSKGNPSPMYTKVFKADKQMLAVQCSVVPSATISIKPKVEETFRFICAVDANDLASNADPATERGQLINKVSKSFSRYYAMHSDQLDQEHAQAWKTLNSASFRVAHSKAPNTLNQAQIDTVRHALLSSVRAPLLESNWSGREAAKKEIERSLSRDSVSCYTGHSTLLTPSKLWQRWTDIRSVLKALDIWKMTLEHRGCSRLLRGPTGAHGLIQAFLLSLSAATFTSSAAANNQPGQLDRNGGSGRMKLEVGLEPETELQRHIQVEGLRVGASGSELTMEFQLDLSLKPFVSLRVTGDGTPLYACTAGCLEAPHALGQKSISLAIKVTRPRTPIIFVSEHREQLEMVKKTLHVIEVVDAPAHEQHLVDLHKHGTGGSGSGGLPTLFWVVLVCVLVCFHLFLFRLLYSEWKNASGPGAPFGKYSRKVLFRRE